MSTEPLSIPGYELEAELARGGMASVFRARQVSLGRPVAIKILSDSLRGDPRFVERFRREAELQALLEHPNIVPILDHGGFYIVMRLIDGPSLRELISIGGVPPDAMVPLLADVAAALDYAHGQGALHQDVKPHNVLVERGEHAWLADFGLTRLLQESTGLTQPSGPIGTFDYLAPELARGERATSAADVYSLSVTAFQALTGRLPFPSDSQAAALLAHTTAPRPAASALAPQLPAAVDRPLRRGMAIDPGQRPESAGELVEELRAALELPPRERRGWRAAANPTSMPTPLGAAPAEEEGASWADTEAPPARPGRRPRGGRRRVSALAVLAICVVVGVGLALGLDRGGSRSAGGERGPEARLGRTYAETVGGPSHTWSDYRTAGGRAGAVIRSNTTVRIACRVRGFQVQDGDRWWYRVASPPWSGRFYVSADAFYNNGETSGTLLHTPLVDPNVKNC